MSNHPTDPRTTWRYRIDRMPDISFAGLEIHTIGRAAGSLNAVLPEPPKEVGVAPGLCVSISPLDPPAASPEVEREWNRIVTANPRVYNGPHLSVVSIDFDEAHIHCRRDTFQRLIVQPRVRTGMRLLAVSALVVARDGKGREHVLLGRRGASVRIYPNMWEFGPAGGVTPPHASVCSLNECDLKRSLAEEMEEEIGVTFPVGEAIAIVRDTMAFSDDIVYRCDAGDLDQARLAMGEPSNWEYSETTWIAVDELGSFMARHAAQIIPPTRAMIGLLGWSNVRA